MVVDTIRRLHAEHCREKGTYEECPRATGGLALTGYGPCDMWSDCPILAAITTGYRAAVGDCADRIVSWHPDSAARSGDFILTDAVIEAIKALASKEGS